MYIINYLNVLAIHNKVLSCENVGGPEKDRVDEEMVCRSFLAAKAVQCAALAFQSIDNIHGSHCFPLGMLSVGNSITDDILKENLQDTTSFLIDETRDTFHSTTTCQTTDRRLGDTLDVVTKNLPVTLGATLSESLSSFATARHDFFLNFCSVSDAKTGPPPYIYPIGDRVSQQTRSAKAGFPLAA
jgi:hypothetical protein